MGKCKRATTTNGRVIGVADSEGVHCAVPARATLRGAGSMGPMLAVGRLVNHTANQTSASGGDQTFARQSTEFPVCSQLVGAEL